MDGKDWLTDAFHRLSRASDQGFIHTSIGHKRWWRQYWNKSAIHISDKEYEKIVAYIKLLVWFLLKERIPSNALTGLMDVR